MFENRVLRRVFVPKRGEVTGEWRKLHNGELYDLYSLPNLLFTPTNAQLTYSLYILVYIYISITLFFGSSNRGE